MYVRILKKDLKRNKTMNLILFLFTILATVFVASGLNNLVSVLNGTDYYLDRAGVGDYVVIAVCGEDDGSIRKILDDSDIVKSYRMDKVIFGTAESLRDEDGKVYESDSSVILQSIDDSELKFFDLANEEIKSIEEGHVFISGKVMKDQHIKVGDKIRVRMLDCEQSFIVDGKAKDALLGSSFMGNIRVLMNETDAAKFYGADGMEDYAGRIVYVDTDQPMLCKSRFTDIPRISFDDPASTIKMTYVMDMIVAFVVVILSVCLMIVSFVLIRFSITFAISEDFREIGVMKAIGIRENKIRSLYMVKYTALGLVGALIGCIISFPFGKFLMKDVTENMMLGNSYGNLVNVAGTFAVVAFIIGFAYLSTGKLKKMTPTDAIRSGETGERFRKKGGYRISRSRVGCSLYLAVNDILSSPRRFSNIVISFTLCTLFVLILANTTATLDSASFIDTFGTRADLYVTDTSAMPFMYREDGKELMAGRLEEMEKELAGEGMPARCSIEIQYKYKFTYDGNEYLYTFQQGMNTRADEYVYEEGSAPQNKNEIAITKKVARDTGLSIGDTVEIDFGTGKEKCTVTALYQTMNQLGSVIRLQEDAPASFLYISSFLQYKINFTDAPSDEEIERRKERLKVFYDNDRVMDQREYCVDSMKALDTVRSVERLLMVITVIVVVLVTILMERSFLSDEKREIAILKAIGFRDREVKKWHVIRFVLIAGISMGLAMALSVPMTKLCMTPIFGLMGAENIDYRYRVGSLIEKPVIILGVTVVIAWVTALYADRIKAKDTAGIE